MRARRGERAREDRAPGVGAARPPGRGETGAARRVALSSAVSNAGARDDPDGDDGRDAAAPRRRVLGATTWLALFGEVGMVGVVVAVLSLPVVTAVPALAAGALHLRRHLSGEGDSFGRLLRGFGAALRDLWALGLLLPLVLLITAYNVLLVTGTSLAGRGVIGVVSAGVGTVGLVVTLRAVGAWVPGVRGPAAVRAAVLRAGRDLPGSVLLVLAVVLCGLLISALEAFLLLVGGLLALAAVAVEDRWATRTDAGRTR
jgi:hypothetical protein